MRRSSDGLHIWRIGWWFLIHMGQFLFTLWPPSFFSTFNNLSILMLFVSINQCGSKLEIYLDRQLLPIVAFQRLVMICFIHLISRLEKRLGKILFKTPSNIGSFRATFFHVWIGSTSLPWLIDGNYLPAWQHGWNMFCKATCRSLLFFLFLFLLMCFSWYSWHHEQKVLDPDYSSRR